MRVFRNIPFTRFMKEHGMVDSQICVVVAELSSGLINANLGGGVYKQRIARQGQGKSGGFRSIVFFKSEFRSVFVMGFAKSEQANITPQDVKSLKDLAKELLGYDDQKISLALTSGTLREVFCN